MNNPVVLFRTNIDEPPNPATERTSYMMKVFDSLNFFIYEKDQSANDFEPINMSQEFYIITQLGTSLGEANRPLFVLEEIWESVSSSPSVFITPNKSVMPKLLTPSTIMVDNGLVMPGSKYSATWTMPGEDNDTSNKYNKNNLLFNWKLASFNGNTIPPAEWYNYAHVCGQKESQYVSVKAKQERDDDGEAQSSNLIEIELDSPSTPPMGEWVSTNLVGGGAFVLMLNVVELLNGALSPVTVGANKWLLEITFGEVTMRLTSTSSMTVTVGDNDTIVNLAESAAKEGPPQMQHMSDGHPLLIGVYPCWNGIIVTSGTQETKEVKMSASTFCRKHKGASIQHPDYSTWFDPKDPNNVEVGVGSNKNSTLVDMGNKMKIVSENCRFEVAYLPRFFSSKMALDGWLLLSDDSDEVEVTYGVYTIYTKNNTSYDVGLPQINVTDIPGQTEGSLYHYIDWDMTAAGDIQQRMAPEIFGYILETKENKVNRIKNGNGEFDLTWSGGTPGDPNASDWTDYIKSISVTTSIDGSSGQIVVDKYGVAGQEAEADQSVGAVVLEVHGGLNTTPGVVFKGLGLGVSNSSTPGDATWTIPLIGLERKLDDISLINPPYMDGESLGVALLYLFGYAGIVCDLSKASQSVVLSATEQINVARFDWKSGSTVRAAIEDVMQDTLHWYCIIDGVAHVYELGSDGLPTKLGPNRARGYDYTNMIDINHTPDFDNLRNYIVAMSLQQGTGEGTTIEDIPTFPLIEARTKDTIPDIPWAKCWVQVFPGYLNPDILSGIADKMSDSSSRYDLTGRLTIEGNADIKPYDTWDDLVVYSVTHNVDLDAKTWTTDLEFMRR